MSKMIHNYTAAGTIDATADLLLIDPASSGIYKSISRNTLLGITGNPLGTTDTQNVTNKTLDTTNTITLKDTLFTLQDDGDLTKQLKFQLSGITTGTTRTLTIPNASDTLVGKATTDTLTNKTLTSPTITGGTIDNSTITVDSISGHTSGTIVSVAGVQMNNGTIGTSGAVVTASIADTAVTPAKLQTGTGSGWAWQSFTPTLTNLTLGNGTMTAKYSQTGKTVNFRIILTAGSTTVVGTSPRFTLPVTAATDYGTTGLQFYVGNVYMNGNAANWAAFVSIDSATGTGACRMLMLSTAGTYQTAAVDVTVAVPDSWPAGSHFVLQGMYEAA